MITQARTNKSAQLVIELRRRFLEEVDKEKDKYDPSDIELIAKDDWYVKRFLLSRNRDVEASLSMLKETMQWRHEMGLPTIKDYQVPLEFYKVGGLFVYEPDREGNIVVYMRICLHKKIPKLERPLKLFLMHVFDKADELAGGNGIVIAFDLTNVGYQNVDWDFLKYLIDCATKYFPVGLKYILVINVPWYLNTLRKVAFALLPGYLIQFIKFASGVDEICNYIAKENLPDYLGGTCKRNFRAIPNGCKSVVDLVNDERYKEFGTKEDIDEIMPLYYPLLEEAEKSLALKSYVDPIGYFDEPPEEEFETEHKGLFRIIPQMASFAYDLSFGGFNASNMVHNMSYTPLAFKIQSNNPKNYDVSPNQGIMSPRSVVKISIRMISNVQVKNNKFLILFLPISEIRMSVEEFDKLWKRKPIKSHKLSVTFNEKIPNGNCAEEVEENVENDIVYQLDILKKECKDLRKKHKEIRAFLPMLIILVFFMFLCQYFSLETLKIF